MNYYQKIINSPSKIFLFGLLSFILGVAISSFIPFDVFLAFCLMLLAIFALFVFWRNQKYRPLLLGAFFLFCGLWRFGVALPDFNDPGRIYYYNGQKLEFTGVIKNVDRRLGSQKLTIEAQELAVGGKRLAASGKVLVTTTLYPEYHYGQAVRTDCKIERPEKISAKGGPASGWDYEKYLARYDIYSVCYSTSFSVLPPLYGFEFQSSLRHSRESGNPGEKSSLSQKIWIPAFAGMTSFLNFSESSFTKGEMVILQIKDKLANGLSQSVVEPQNALLQALLLNNRGGLSQDWLDKFAVTGVTHIIAISGSHIVIIVMILTSLLIGCGVRRPKAFWPLAAIIVFYVVMIGAPASAVRAAIMGLLVLYAQKIGRLSQSLNLVVLAAAVMLAVNPKVLIFDVGFQLSFAAVLGLVYLMPVLEKYFSRLPRLWQVKEILIMTIAAQIATLPLIIFYFRRLSLASFAANILVLPVVPFLMVLGFVNAVLGAIFVPLGQAVGYASYFAAGYFLVVVEYLSRLPLASIDLPALHFAVVAVLYGLIFWWVYRAKSA